MSEGSFTRATERSGDWGPRQTVPPERLQGRQRFRDNRHENALYIGCQHVEHRLGAKARSEVKSTEARERPASSSAALCASDSSQDVRVGASSLRNP